MMDRRIPALRSALLASWLLISVGNIASQGVHPLADDSERGPLSDPPTKVPARALPADDEEEEYRIGPNDLLAVTALGAPDLSGSFRVMSSGDISYPLLGPVKAGGLTPVELQSALEEKLRGTYMKDPDVTVQVTEMQSRWVSILGAVNKPGNYPLRESRPLVEVLSLAGGLSEKAGGRVLIFRSQQAGGRAVPSLAGADEARPLSSQDDTSRLSPHSSGAPSGENAAEHVIEVDLGLIHQSPALSQKVEVHPGDVVHAEQAGIVYIIGEVNKPGSFPVLSQEQVTVLQGLALGGGLTRTAAKGRTVIFRTDEHGERTEIALDLNKVLKGRAPDVPLQPKDILFVPNSTSRSVARGTVDALVRMVTLRTVL